jgi:Rod binding domain-containing protein
MVSVAPAVRTTDAEPARYVAKVRHAAEQFEGILLESLLGPMEKAFSSLPGDKSEFGSGDYSSLGTQVLASALAAKGGLGIAQMIVGNLMKHGLVTGQAATPTG